MKKKCLMQVIVFIWTIGIKNMDKNSDVKQIENKKIKNKEIT